MATYLFMPQLDWIDCLDFYIMFKILYVVKEIELKIHI